MSKQNNVNEVKTKGLTEHEVLDICKIVGCNREQVKSSQYWCYFPADSELISDIHYEILRGNVEFHIECEAQKLKEIIEKNPNADIVRKSKKSNQYKLKSPSKDIFKDFKQLKNCIQGYIDEYKKELRDNYKNHDEEYVKAINNGSLYPEYQNFFNLLSDCRDDDSNGKLSENDHSRILLAILKSRSYREGRHLPVLYSFIQQLGIDCNVDDVKLSDIRFNKGYNIDNYQSYIDGLIYKEEKFAIIIENKIEGAGDQPQQIERYIKSLHTFEKIDLDNIWVIYLTKDGTLHDTGRPTEESYKNDSPYNIDNRLLCINYHDDILPWLKESALPIVKYTDASVGLVTDSYIDYLEHMFQEDIASRRIAEEMKKGIFDICNIAERPMDIQYKVLDRIVKELSNTTIYENLVMVLQNYMREIINPLYDAFRNATIAYFKSNGHDVYLNNNWSSGFIQIIGKDWDRHIHYEWCQITAQSLFFETKPITLYIHIEGKAFKTEKDIFKNNNKMDYSCSIGNESIAEKIANNSIGDWLSKQYDQIIDSWDELEKISMKQAAG